MQPITRPDDNLRPSGDVNISMKSPTQIMKQSRLLVLKSKMFRRTHRYYKSYNRLMKNQTIFVIKPQIKKGDFRSPIPLCVMASSTMEL